MGWDLIFLIFKRFVWQKTSYKIVREIILFAMKYTKVKNNVKQILEY